MKLNIKSFFARLLLLMFVFLPVSTVFATEYSDNFDTDPYSGRWTNEIGNAVWDSVNGEFDINNDSESAYRYSAGELGSIDHEAQVTALLVSTERLMGPGVRFNNVGQNDMYGVSFESGIINIYRWNNGIRTHLASLLSGITSIIGDYYSIRMSASGDIGNPVVLSVWIQNHGSTKPNDPGWIGNDNSPTVTFTDSSTAGTRLDFSENSHAGIAGRANPNSNDNRHDYFKARAIVDRGEQATPSLMLDTTPPVISNIVISNLAINGATISWITNETSTSQVQYGTSISYGNINNSSGTTNHSVTLSNLTSNSTYNFRISATDQSGNNSLSANQTFITLQDITTNPNPTADLQVNGGNSGVTINNGSSVTLTWTSTNATSCTVTPGNYNGTSGTQTLTPTSNTTYTLNCSGAGGSVSDSIVVNVNQITTLQPSTSGLPTPTGSGKYLYVSPTGDDSVSYANNSSSNPWRTIGRAAWGSTNRSVPNSTEAAKAGDVVVITGGTYDFSGSINSRFSSVYNPVNSGTSNNYITFACSGDCVLTSSSANSPVIGSSERNYIKWYADISQGNSWVINSCGMQSGCPNGTVNTTPDTGPVVCHASTGCYIEGATIDGTTPVDYTDNWNGIRVENAPSAVIRNNTIRNFRTQSGSRNASGVTLYGSANTIVENNQISNVAGGVYMKHNAGSSLSMTNVRVRYNNISNTNSCVSWSLGTGSNHFYQNICTDSTFGAFITGIGLNNDWIFNNTFINISGAGVYPSASGTGGRSWNNICANCSAGIMIESGPMPTENVIDFEHNVYHNFSNFYTGFGGNQTFTSFKTTYPTHEQSNPASIEADPMFVSTTNFRLQSGSPARTLGVDILDLDGDGSTTDIIPAGAYITGNEVIGLNTGGTVIPPPPTTPTPVTPPPTPLPTTFTIGQRVQTTANLNVRATANGTLLGNQPTASLGTIVGTGVTVSSTNWWNVNYDSGVDGWSSEQFLQSYTAPVTPPVTPPSTSTTTSNPTTPPSGGGGSAPAPTTPTTLPSNTGAGGASAPTTPPTNTGGTVTTPTPPSTPTTSIPKPTLTRTVYLGSKGSDVTSLQTFLINTGYLKQGLNTGYFGPATKDAVQRYQCSNLNICSGSELVNGYGVVGPKTKQAILSETKNITNNTSILTSERREEIQKQINGLLLLVQQLIEKLKTIQGN